MQVGLVELGNHLPLLDHAVVVDIELGHDARHLGTHIDRGHGLDGTGGGDTGRDAVFLDLGGLKAHCIFVFFASQQHCGDCNDGESHHCNDDCLLDCSFLFLFHYLVLFLFLHLVPCGLLID